MKAESKSNATLLIGGVAFLFIVIGCGSYCAGYFWLGEQRVSFLCGDAMCVQLNERVFPNATLAVIYRPAAAIESWLIHADVIVVAESDE